MATAYDAAAIGAGFVPGSGMLDVLGLAPAIGGGMGPSFYDNIKNKQYIDALLQMAGAAGDAAMIMPPVGMTVKGAVAAGKTARAASKGAKIPRMSAAEAEAAGLWHKIGDTKKLTKPVSEMRAEREPVKGLIDRLTVDPQSMQGGSIIPMLGDRSIAGQNLLSVGGTKFIDPVYLEGGYDFMRTHSPEGTVWAADLGRARGLQNVIDLAADKYGPNVYGAFSSMGHGSMNFNTMMSDALLEQMKAGKITKKAINSFDKQVKAIRPEWKGVMSPEARAQLESNGALRHAFVDRMQLEEFQKAGFPDIAETRWAITDPRLLDEPMYSSGLGISRMAPGSDLVTNPVTPHKTYNTQLRGQYIGGTDASIPISVMYPDFFKQRRAIGAPVSGDLRSFELGRPAQPTNQEWLDGLMKYLESQAAP